MAPFDFTSVLMVHLPFFFLVLCPYKRTFSDPFPHLLSDHPLTWLPFSTSPTLFSTMDLVFVCELDGFQHEPGPFILKRAVFLPIEGGTPTFTFNTEFPFPRHRPYSKLSAMQRGIFTVYQWPSWVCTTTAVRMPCPPI